MGLLRDIDRRLFGGFFGGRATVDGHCKPYIATIQEISPKGAMNLSTFYACVEMISTDVAKLPLEPYHVDDVGRKTKAIHHPVYPLLAMMPNEGSTSFTFFQSLICSVLLYGDGFATIERDPNTGVAEAITFEPYHDVVVEYSSNMREITGYVVRGRRYEPNDMIHVLGYSYDGLRGVSVIQHAARVLGISSASDKQASDFFTSGGGTRGVLTTDKPRINQKERDDLRQEWRENVNNGDGVAILDNGIKYHQLTFSPSDVQLLESRQFNVVEICRFFRVSPVKVGDLTKSSYSTVEATGLSYLTDTLSTYLVKVEQEFWRKVFPPKMRKSMRLLFDTTAVVKADSASRTQRTKELVALGIMTINEAREQEGLPAIDGGDEPLIMTNMARLGAIISDGPEATPISDK